MSKPEPKREVAVDYFVGHLIFFYSGQDAISDFYEFGQVNQDGPTNRYCLEVDPRYDFTEVLAYIQNYGND